MLNKASKILALITLLSLSKHTNAQEYVNGFKGLWCTLGQYGPYGDKYSGGLGTYTAKHLPLAVYSESAQKTFFTYGGTTGSTDDHLLIMLSYYDHETEQLARPVIVYDKKGVTDPHDNAAIQLDSEGYIWVFISGRYSARNGYIFRSDHPHDISGFSEVLNEPFNYPQPKYINGKGFVLLMTNYGNGRELFTQRSADGYSWTRDKKLVNFGGHYQVSGNTDSKIGSAFNWHKGGDVNNRTNLYYMRSLDLGDNWETIDGTPISTPITRSSNAALIKDYAALNLKVYLKDFRYDENGYPVILYITSPKYAAGPSNPKREWRLVRWNGSEWIFSKITNAYHNYDMGSLYFDDDGTYRIVAPTEPGPQEWGTGGEIAIWESDNQGANWISLGTITENSVRNHTYARRPVNTNADFYAFWADGNTDAFSRSYLYFSNKYGDVYQMPYSFSDDFIDPIPFGEKEEIYPQIVSELASTQGYPAIKAVDGAIHDESRWEARSFPKSIVIDYGEEKSFNMAKLQTTNNRSYNYTVALSNDLNFNDITVDRTNNTSTINPCVDNFTRTLARYAKLTIKGQNNSTDRYIKISEFTLRDSDTSTTGNLHNHPALHVFPNPVVQNLFFVDGLLPQDIIEIYTSNGVMLYKLEATSSKVSIPCETFPNGVVLINIISGNSNHSIKAVINR
ncbi:BNR-4 repeat-containing protein [Labilibacter marinus]|uniref:BNR-4 repeat-containing protein n=1 Tax=Labilibacter marinus TaxID=1477105 RepID=UPI0008362126|nr:BNR-4 repeat-containing protein [Labilibacter marinus]